LLPVSHDGGLDNREHDQAQNNRQPSVVDEARTRRMIIGVGARRMDVRSDSSLSAIGDAR
jgi:hypothetical protein